MRCVSCQHEIKDQDLICPNCGRSLKDDSPQSMNMKISIQSFASNSAGEMSFLNQTFSQELNPMIVLEKKAIGMMTGFKTIFKNKRKLIIIAILAIVWILLILLPYLGFNPLPVKVLSFLTFAQGGASLNTFRAVGGLLGKGVYAIFFVSLFDGQFKSIIRGIKPLMNTIKQTKKGQFAFFLVGIGVACILYNFLTGYAALIKSMIGIASLSLVLQAFNSKQGFVYAFIMASTASRKNKQPIASHERTESLMSGLVIGFTLSILLSIIPIGYAPYIFGALIVIIGVILMITSKNIEVQS